MITCKNNYGELVTLPKEKFVFRPSVYGIIRNDDKICICKNKSNNKIWFPGGGIDIGETRKEALVREIKEEAGLENVQVGKLLGAFESFFYYQPKDIAMQAFLFFYECFAQETILKTNDEIDDDEAIDFQWISIDKLKKDDLGDFKEEIFTILASLDFEAE
jgi:8-oxo-dGTP diphosphatase